MELKPGYKQTEVGVIPEDWHVEPLVRVCEPKGIVRGPFGGALKKEIFVANGFNVYEQRNAIYKSCATGSYFVDQAKYSEMQRFSVTPGDFIVSCSGTIGCIYMLPFDAPEGVINQALLKLRVNGDVAMPGFFYIYFGWDDFQARIVDSTQGGAMKNLVGMSIFKNTPIVLPPRPEQNAITSALGDMNALLSSLEQLLAKKQEIKLAAMQELLTGKRRLPGFKGEWEVTTVKDVVSRHFCGPSPTCEERNIEGDHEWGVLKTTAITWEKGWSWKAHKLLPPSYWDKTDIELRKGDVLVTKAGPRHRVGVSAWVDHLPSRIIPSGKMIALRPILKKAEPLMLAAAIASRETQIFLDQRTTGMAESQINFENSVMLSAPISLPSIEEQSAISGISSDFDKEIRDLESKIDSLRGIKEGMMQQLLTGKIRLT